VGRLSGARVVGGRPNLPGPYRPTEVGRTTGPVPAVERTSQGRASVMRADGETEMPGRSVSYVLVAAAAFAVGLLVAGTPLPAVLPYAALLARPLMMVVMMRGMSRGDHGDTGAGSGDRPSHSRSGSRKGAVAAGQGDGER
jgi:hypothetical protein